MANDIAFKPSEGKSENSKELLYGATQAYLTAMLNREKNPVSSEQRAVLLARANAAMENRLAVQAVHGLNSKTSASTTYREGAQMKIVDMGS